MIFSLLSPLGKYFHVIHLEALVLILDSSFWLLLMLANSSFYCKACANDRTNAGTVRPRHLPTSVSCPPLGLLFLARSVDRHGIRL